MGVVAAFGVFAAAGGLGVPVALVVYVVIVPLMWIAHTEGGLRTVVAVAVLATSVAAVTRLFGLTEQAFNYQAAMIAIAGTGLYNLAVPRLYADNSPATIAERLRTVLAQDPWDGVLEDRRVTASFGVVSIAPDETLAGALERADRALYEAKRAGRDQVRQG